MELWTGREFLRARWATGLNQTQVAARSRGRLTQGEVSRIETERSDDPVSLRKKKILLGILCKKLGIRSSEVRRQLRVAEQGLCRGGRA